MGRLTKKIGEPDPPREEHCDDVIMDFDSPNCLRHFILINRLPAIEKWVVEEAGAAPLLFATYKGKRVKVNMASRLGDVGITFRLKGHQTGYSERVMLSSLSEFSTEADYISPEGT